jgi:hypothetical protein
MREGKTEAASSSPYGGGGLFTGQGDNQAEEEHRRTSVWHDKTGDGGRVLFNPGTTECGRVVPRRLRISGEPCLFLS